MGASAMKSAVFNSHLPCIRRARNLYRSLILRVNSLHDSSKTLCRRNSIWRVPRLCCHTITLRYRLVLILRLSARLPTDTKTKSRPDKIQRICRILQMTPKLLIKYLSIRKANETQHTAGGYQAHRISVAGTTSIKIRGERSGSSASANVSHLINYEYSTQTLMSSLAGPKRR
jgi:hypothetical protein